MNLESIQNSSFRNIPARSVNVQLSPTGDLYLSEDSLGVVYKITGK